ncbi:DUF6266 family protein [Pedobacter africanus]|uniref:Uncharacterized protein n=1 Tax=Pedobacter africanus TaxID=151894 RepID=A0A1W1Z650_9SPHI|nr:DUF6266 family protein [Pedobacter africanus]SMC43846.1 hypothetical protein SAMN04488524_0404 [Pedobacter africanus]
MGKLTGGIDYDMIGLLGNHVGRRTKGENIIAMRPAKSNKPPTQAQLNQRLKFALMAGWLRRLAAVINVGFQEYDAEMSPRNAALSWNLKNAIAGASPNYTIDYANVVYSKGLLDLPQAPQIAPAAGAKLDYSWGAVSGDTNGLATDKVTFAVYNPAKNKFVTLKGGAVRSALAYSLQLPPDWSGDGVEAYLSMVSADGKLVSDSYYVGPFTVL